MFKIGPVLGGTLGASLRYIVGSGFFNNLSILAYIKLL